MFHSFKIINAFFFEMDPPKFEDFSESISNLFESKGKYWHNCIHVLGANVGLMEFHKRLFNSFIGNIDGFHSWAKPKLDDFFTSFVKDHFLSSNERVNRRRHFEYEEIVVSKSYKKNTFKKKMMEAIKLDIASCLNEDGEYAGECTDTEENRRLLFLNFIKNYVLRLFLIPIQFE